MMNVEIDNGHFFNQAASDCPLSCHRNVVKEAKSHRSAAFSMVARRPNEGKSGVDPLLSYLIDEAHGTASS